MAGQYCDNCVYSVCDPELWRRWLWMREPIVPRCANHPRWPGQLHDVPGVPCRNYRPKPTLPNGDAVRMIPLGDGFYAYVDAADYEELSQYKWRLHDGYAYRREGGRGVFMHRQIMQVPKSTLVDHTDGNRANDCRLNLRRCTPGENLHNARKHCGSSSRFKGVARHKSGKWSARCQFAGTMHYLGLFDSEVEAARAYDLAAVRYFAEFARLNFPEEWPPQRRQEVHAQFQRAPESSTSRIRGSKSSAKIRRGESSFARTSIVAHKAKAKKKREQAAGRSEKGKGKNRKSRAETRGHTDRRRATEKGTRKRSRAANAGTPPK